MPALDLNDPLFTITFPLLVGIFIAIWNQSRHFDRAIEQISKRIDDANRRIDDVVSELRQIRSEIKEVRTELADLNRRLSIIEDCSGLVRR